MVVVVVGVGVAVGVVVVVVVGVAVGVAVVVGVGVVLTTARCGGLFREVKDMALKTDGIGPSLTDWAGEEAYRADREKETVEENYEQEFLTWNRLTYSSRYSVKNRELMEEVMREALENLYDSPLKSEQLHWLLYNLYSGDEGAIPALQALLEPYIMQAARPHIEKESMW